VQPDVFTHDEVIAALTWLGFTKVERDGIIADMERQRELSG
jgi:hypothetical protein